jgi:alanine dehydrogenase
MKPGAVIIDVAIDQGGCVETARPTTHSEPTYIEQGIVHYCVTNMPGAVGRTSTYALCNVTFPYVQRIVSDGLEMATAADPGLAEAVNVHAGKVTNQAVAQSLGMTCEAFAPGVA